MLRADADNVFELLQARFGGPAQVRQISNLCGIIANEVAKRVKLRA